MVDNKFVRWDEKIHHPSERCGGTATHGQCPFCKVNGSDYCARHGANKALINQRVERLRNYRLAKWRNRVGEFADSPGIKSLRDEIGILRLTLETMLESCNDSMELILYSQRISDLVMKIEKLVVSCDKLENRMGMLLDKKTVLYLAQRYVEIINDHVTEPDVIDAISNEMVQATAAIEVTVDE
jgi:hypothetical protein